MTRGEVWWVEFDPAVGTEIQKTRPAVIVSNDRSNNVLSRVVVVPFTSNVKKVHMGNVIISINGHPSKMVSDQIMTADKSRLKSCITTLSDGDMKKVEAALRSHLCL